MKFLILFLLSFNAWAMSDEALRQQWLGRVKVTDRHTGYQNGQSLTAPAGTWQTLFSVALSETKHCVYAQIPVKAKAGKLKIVETKLTDLCTNGWEKSAVWEQSSLRSIQFSVTDEEITLWWATEDSRQHTFVSKIPAIKGVFLYAPNSDELGVKVDLVGKLDDAYPASPCSFEEGTCQLCRYGAYRVPGATPEYYCGVDRCGESNFPACSRGKRWQKSRGPYSCRGNNDHVFCAQGLKIECAGEVAICR